MTTNEALERKLNESLNKNAELEKEIKKLKEMNEGLVQTQIKILQNALRGDKETIAINEQTIQNGKRMVELSSGVEKSVAEVAKLALEATMTIEKVNSSAKAVGQVAGQVYEQADIATKGTAQVLEMGKEVAAVSNQMAVGMQQVSTASQQVSTGAQKLAELSQTAARSTETLRKVRDRLLPNLSGIVLVSMYYRNAFEMVQMLKENPWLQERLREVVAKNIRVAEQLIAEEQAVVSAEQTEEVVQFLEEIKARGSVRLQKDLDVLITGIEDGYLLQDLGIQVE